MVDARHTRWRFACDSSSSLVVADSVASLVGTDSCADDSFDPVSLTLSGAAGGATAAAARAAGMFKESSSEGASWFVVAGICADMNCGFEEMKSRSAAIEIRSFLVLMGLSGSAKPFKSRDGMLFVAPKAPLGTVDR